MLNNTIENKFGNTRIVDFKRGDVNGDKIIDNIFLTGEKPFGENSLFVENITLVIQDGKTGMIIKVPLEYNAGYFPRLFLADFTDDKIDDIKITIEAGGSGGYVFYYIFSFANNILRLLFDFNEFNKRYKYTVDYQDYYKVNVVNTTLNKKYIIDISNKDPEYLSQIYDSEGKLIEPIKGEVLPLGGLFPIVIDEKSGLYDLLAKQRIIGRYNADTLGYVNTLLRWNGQMFELLNQELAVLGSNV